MTVRTKIELTPALVRRISGLDDFARIFFPDNRNHQRAFVAIWLEIKYSRNQFLPSCKGIAVEYDLTERTLETVRAKMKRLGLIRRISHFAPSFGNRSGWTFSARLRYALTALADTLAATSQPTTRPVDEQKDRHSILYI